ncbi:MAG: hypothetical protein KF805_07685 [Phycisphaeraceae bacterium]|nr:hypothetical protein [Phycisphaeraceae bacterium]
MRRSLLALCVLPLALPASAGVTYTTDNRFVQAVNSFGLNQARTPPVAFAPFNDTAQVATTMADGSCSSVAMHDSQMNAVQMSGNGSVTANSATFSSSPLVFAGSGTSRFEVVFMPDASGTIHLTGQLAGTAGKSTLLAELKLGAAVLFTKSTSGSIDFQTGVSQNSQYKLTVSCAANSLLTWTGAPASASATASFSFTADVAATCIGDLNNDGFVDDLDFSIFAPAYDLLDCSDPNMPAGCPADLNDDGFVDDLDFTLFAPAYNELLCP